MAVDSTHGGHKCICMEKLSAYVIYAYVNRSVIGKTISRHNNLKKRASVSGCLPPAVEQHLTVSISYNSLLTFNHTGGTPDRRSISSDRTRQSPFIELRIDIHLYPVQCCCWGVQCWAHSQRKCLRIKNYYCVCIMTHSNGHAPKQKVCMCL